MTVCKTCKHANYCEIVAGGYSSQVKSCRDYRKGEATNEEWMRSATFEELAGAIYEWHTKGYARGRLEVDLNPITEVVEWLKQPHNSSK